MNLSDSTDTRAVWIAAVAERLGYPGRMPHELYRRIESLWLMGMSVDEAVAKLA